MYTFFQLEMVRIHDSRNFLKKKVGKIYPLDAMIPSIASTFMNN